MITHVPGGAGLLARAEPFLALTKAFPPEPADLASGIALGLWCLGCTAIFEFLYQWTKRQEKKIQVNSSPQSLT